jgi:hypothetical protein
MKHVKGLSVQKPAQAAETAWVELKNIIGGLPLNQTQRRWVFSQVDQFLQK